MNFRMILNEHTDSEMTWRYRAGLWPPKMAATCIIFIDPRIVTYCT